MLRSPKLAIPCNPTVDSDWKREALEELKYAFATNTLNRADKKDLAKLFSNQEFIEFLSRSNLVGNVLNHLSSVLIECYEDVRTVALEYGVAPPDVTALESMEATCMAISKTDCWKTAMTSSTGFSYCNTQEGRLCTVSDAYRAGKSLNHLLQASKMPWRSSVKVEWVAH